MSFVDLDSSADVEETVRVIWRPTCKLYMLEVRTTSPLIKVCEELSRRCGVPSGQIELQFKDEPVDLMKSLELINFNVSRDSLWACERQANFSGPAVDEEVNSLRRRTRNDQLELKIICSGRQTVTVYLRPTEPLKLAIPEAAKTFKAAEDKIRLMFDGEIVNLDGTPLSLDIDNGDCLEAHF